MPHNMWMSMVATHSGKIQNYYMTAAYAIFHLDPVLTPNEAAEAHL